MGTDDRGPSIRTGGAHATRLHGGRREDILITGAGGGIGGICGGSLRASASLLARGNEPEDGGH